MTQKPHTLESLLLLKIYKTSTKTSPSSSSLKSYTKIEGKLMLDPSSLKRERINKKNSHAQEVSEGMVGGWR